MGTWVRQGGRRRDEGSKGEKNVLLGFLGHVKERIYSREMKGRNQLVG